ncbi:phospholipase D [Striga asiatica]|uniref:Phospholipase D n=1 Tax=Striga asiatica TaxID=4170 RepID=A0A5A7RE16_STRAF|nr:phospholipase D [Striga asiatica]
MNSCAKTSPFLGNNTCVTIFFAPDIKGHKPFSVRTCLFVCGLLPIPRRPCFHIYCAHNASNVIFTVKDDNPIGATLIERACVPVDELVDAEEIDRWVEILDENKNPIRENPRSTYWTSLMTATGTAGSRVPDTLVYCTLSTPREQIIVSPYTRTLTFQITSSLGGTYYESHRCWEDVFYAITNAKHLIYITAWSVYTFRFRPCYHQRIVVVVSDLPSGQSDKRRIVSFVGGIDLCDGSYDSPFHRKTCRLGNSSNNDGHSRFVQASSPHG